jgi:ketosteroid isomerase-like protein
MSNLRQATLELDELTAKGDILVGLEKFYAEDCSFAEPDGSGRQSRQAQHDHLSGFFASLKSFNGATLHGSSVGDDLSMSEFTFDMTGGDGEPIIWNEVLVRRWRDGKVVSEKFYQA